MAKKVRKAGVSLAEVMGKKPLQQRIAEGEYLGADVPPMSLGQPPPKEEFVPSAMKARLPKYVSKEEPAPEPEPREPVKPTREPPQRQKRNVLTEILKIAGQGLESYAGQRAGEEEAYKEDLATYHKEAKYGEKGEAYRKKLHDYNAIRYEALKKKKAEGKLTDPAEIREFITRGGTMVEKKKRSAIEEALGVSDED